MFASFQAVAHAKWERNLGNWVHEPCPHALYGVDTHATIPRCSATLDVDKRFTFCCCSTVVL